MLSPTRKPSSVQLPMSSKSCHEDQVTGGTDRARQKRESWKLERLSYVCEGKLRSTGQGDLGHCER